KIALGLALWLAPAIAAVALCYGKYQTNGIHNDNCTSNPCSYDEYTPQYSSCATSQTPTGNVCSYDSDLYTGIKNQNYTGGTCAGGSCTSGTANGSPTLLNPQPNKCHTSSCPT